MSAPDTDTDDDAAAAAADGVTGAAVGTAAGHTNWRAATDSDTVAAHTAAGATVGRGGAAAPASQRQSCRCV